MNVERTQHPKPTAEQIAEIIALRKQGATKAQIRDRVGICEDHITKIWKAHVKAHPEDDTAKPGNRGLASISAK